MVELALRPVGEEFVAAEEARHLVEEGTKDQPAGEVFDGESHCLICSTGRAGGPWHDGVTRATSRARFLTAESREVTFCGLRLLAAGGGP